MMRMKNTVVLIVIAVVLALAAIFAIPSSVEPETFSDQGELFFPDFTDPFACRELVVYEPDPETASVSVFSVKFDDGLWRIPSHNGYPADAKDRMATAASSLIGLGRDMFRSERIEDRTALGVEDPLDESSSVDGRGKRVVMKDASGRTLADIIVGKKVEDSRDASDLMRQPKEWVYMRMPESKRIYSVNMRPSMESRGGELIDKISTKFNEWIDTDLLQVDRAKIAKLLLQNYSVDETTGTLAGRETMTLTLDGEKKWQLEGLAEGEQIKETSTRQLVSALDSVKIEGVRPQPETLNAMSLQSKGFFVGKDGGLFGNEGQIAVYTDEGIIYHLFFGEVLMGSGKAVTAGVEEEAEEGEEKTVATENRYVFVRVQLDPELEKNFNEAKAAFDEEEKNKPAEEEIAAAEEGGEPKEEEKSEAQKNYEEFKEELDSARERMDELNLRFTQWYYVISGTEFDKLKVDRSELVELKLPDTSMIGEQPEDPREPVKRPSGLAYVDLNRGEGISAWDGDTVKVLYTGWLKDGSEFDSNQDRENPFTFVLGEGQVIKGWDEGVRGMNKDGKRKLLIPPDLGYGAEGAGEKIPPQSFLVFDVELLDIVKKDAAPPSDG